jgi:UDP-3-O-[3-hydroxymyristoyl] glucosamine N-acyltransferase
MYYPSHLPQSRWTRLNNFFSGKAVFDFGDGRGAVSAAPHVNPDKTAGGWVASTAKVGQSAFVSPDAVVFQDAVVADAARVEDCSQVFGKARMTQQARTRDRAKVGGCALMRQQALASDDAVMDNYSTAEGECWLRENVQVKDDAVVGDQCRLEGDAVVGGSSKLSGRVYLGGHVVVEGKSSLEGNVRAFDYVWIGGEAHITGRSELRQRVHVGDYAEVCDSSLTGDVKMSGHSKAIRSDIAMKNGFELNDHHVISDNTITPSTTWSQVQKMITRQVPAAVVAPTRGFVPAPLLAEVATSRMGGLIPPGLSKRLKAFEDYFKTKLPVGKLPRNLPLVNHGR